MDEENGIIPQNSDQEIEIPAGEWQSFFNEFSRKHDQQIATLEVTGATGEREVEIRERPFSGVSYDQPGTGETRVFVGLSDEDPANHLAHSIIQPTNVASLPNDGGLTIRSADGSVTVLRFVRAEESGRIGSIAA